MTSKSTSPEQGGADRHEKQAIVPKSSDTSDIHPEPNGNQFEGDNMGKDLTIKFKDWGFKIDRLYEVAHRFYKRNESKAFHPTFDERNHMNALILQATYGNFDSVRVPDIGVLDLVGKSRRNEWSTLHGMSKTEAMSKFIYTLDELCPIFKAYAEAVKLSSGQQAAQTRLTPDNHLSEPLARVKSEQSIETGEQLEAIKTSLFRQTYDQFKKYAEKQHPEDTVQQKYLIKSLQEQYYQQYISQMQPKLGKDVNKLPVDESTTLTSVSGKSHASSQDGQLTNQTQSEGYVSIDFANSERKDKSIEETQGLSVDGLINQPRQPQYNDKSNIIPNVSPPVTYSKRPMIPAFEPFEPPVLKHKQPSEPQPINYQHVVEPPKISSPDLPTPIHDLPPPPPPPPHLAEPSPESTTEERQNIETQEPIVPEVQQERQIDTWSCGSSSGACSPLNQSFSYEPLEPASMSTKRGIPEFKESLTDDKHAGAYVVKQGVLLTVQVPTYPDGRFIYFEFATDDYDIGFGLDFIYESNLAEPLAIRIQEESDEDDDDESLADDFQNMNPDRRIDVESQGANDGRSLVASEQAERKLAERSERESRTISIIPTYRRDSHEEVFVVRHRYPGQGYYLLKFDNTYSVLRSKSLFFRICYFI